MGLLGQGASGAKGVKSGTYAGGGGGGSGGANSNASYQGVTATAGAAGAYGGGAGSYAVLGPNVCVKLKLNPGCGGARIIWPGCSRTFPSTNTGNV